ncbi:MAG: sigma-70 family RNA polymerase sigma factor [Gemmataceae bacterium]
MSDVPETRLSLLLRLRDRADGDAWTRFVDLYGPLVYGLARRHGLGDADAADRMQEVLLALARGVERYDAGRGPFRKWLFTVTMNKLRTFWKSSRHDFEPAGNLEEVPAAADPDERWDREYRQRLFAAAVEAVRPRVDPTHWRVFWLAAVEGQPGAAVAAECKVKVEQVYVIRQRVQKKLTSAIAQLEEE